MANGSGTEKRPLGMLQDTKKETHHKGQVINGSDSDVMKVLHTDASSLSVQEPYEKGPDVLEPRVKIDSEHNWQLPRKKRKFEVPRQIDTSRIFGSSTCPPEYQDNFFDPNKVLKVPLKVAQDHKSNDNEPLSAANQWNLIFPTDPSGVITKRDVEIPTTFQNQDHYMHLWRLAICEELNLKLAILARVVHAKMSNFIPLKNPSKDKLKGEKNQRSRSVVKDSIEHNMRRAGVPYHEGCSLELSQIKSYIRRYQKGKATNVDDEDSCKGSKEKMFLKLKNLEKRENYRYYQFSFALIP